MEASEKQSNDGKGSGALLSLLIGIKRRVHRRSDDKAKQADVQFRAQRPAALERARYRCIHCGFRSQNLNEVHHLDDNHHNNDPKNLACICLWCHPYHHIGESARNVKLEGLEEGHIGPKASALIRVPENAPVSAQDLNHLLRALAIALSDENEAPIARQIFDCIVSRENLEQTAAAFLPRKTADIKRLSPADMAAAFMHLTDDEYEQRGQTVADVRLVYTPAILARWGRGVKKEQPAFADPSRWEKMLQKPLALVLTQPESQGGLAGDADSVGAEALIDEDEEDDPEDDDE